MLFIILRSDVISKLFFLAIACSTIINFNNNILSIENYNIPNEVTLDNGGRQIFYFPQSMKIDPCPVYNLFFNSVAAAALSNSQIRSLRDSSAICYSLPRWTTEQIQNIAIEAISILDPTALSGFISPEIIAKFLPNQIASLTPAQIKTLKPNQIEALTPTQFLALTPTQIIALTVSQIAALTPVKIAVLTSTQIPALTSPQIAALTQAQIAALTQAQIAALTSPQMAALTTVQIAALTPVQISALTTVQIPALTPAQIPALTVSQIQALTEKQIRGFQTTPIKQIVAFTPDQISNFSISQMKSLTAEQFLTLIPSQIAKISNQCLPEIINQLSNTQISGLTNEQIVSLPADKLSAFIIARDILVLINKIIPKLSTNMAKVPTLTLEAQNKIKPYLNSNQVFEEIFKVALLDQTPAADVLNLLKRLVYLKAEYYVSSNLNYQKLLDLASKILGAITDPAQSSNGKIKTYEDAIVNKSGDTSFVFWYSLLLDYPSTRDYVNLFLDISARTILTTGSVSLINNIIQVLNPSDANSKNFRLSQLYCFDSSKTIANTSTLLSQAKTLIESTLRTSSVNGQVSVMPSSSDLKTTTIDFLIARKNELLENQTEGLWDASKLSPLYSAAARPSALDTGKLMSMFSFWSFVKQWSNLLIRFDFEKYKLLSIISSFKSSVNLIFNSMAANTQTNNSPQIYLIKSVLDDISKEVDKISAVKTIPLT